MEKLKPILTMDDPWYGPTFSTFDNEKEARSFYDYWREQNYTLIVNNMKNAMIPSPSIICVHKDDQRKELIINTYSNMSLLGNLIRRAIRCYWGQ